MEPDYAAYEQAQDDFRNSFYPWIESLARKEGLTSIHFTLWETRCYKDEEIVETPKSIEDADVRYSEYFPAGILASWDIILGW